MIKKSFLLALLFLFSQLSFAAETPHGSSYDNRIQYVNYNDGDVVVVKAVSGLGARIVFSPTENILDVASGFTQGWEFNDRRNILYIKPKTVKAGTGQEAGLLSPTPEQWNTNLMVTTNLRMYDFDLQLLPDTSDKQASYRVEFRYPADEQAAREKEAEKQAATKKLTQKPTPRNWHYTMQVGKKSKAIAPTMAYDDGRFTYLQFPNNREFPAVFVVADDKKESLVNTHVDNDILVIHHVSPELVLRLGNAVVGIYNESFDADGLPPDNGTTVSGAKRIILGDGQ